jgi:hypothetical protein
MSGASVSVEPTRWDGCQREARGDGERKAHRQCAERAHGEVAPPLDERDAEAGKRAELRPDHHRADDEDLRVLDDPDRSDESREDHEGQVAPRELGTLGRMRLDALPDHRVGWGTDGFTFCSASRGRDDRVDRLDGNGALGLEAELAKLSDDDARILPGDVGEEQVSSRPLGGSR